MDLGIGGKSALVCAASKGLGKGCALALAGEGAAVTLVARNPQTLEAAAEEIRAATGARVSTVAADITTAAGRAAALAACPAPDILVNNAGGPPAGDFRDWDRDVWIKALDANMLTPIELIKAVVDGMAERGFGRVVNITSGAVKAPIDILGLSNGARSGLTLALVGALLGHSDPETTRRYVNFVTDDPLRERVEQVAASVAAALGLAPGPIPAGRGPGRKLDEERVKAIRADTRSSTLLAAELGVSISLVAQIRKGKKWGQVSSIDPT